MSYATIEEAWGGFGTQQEPQEQPKRRMTTQRRVSKPQKRTRSPKQPVSGPKPAAFHGQNPVLFRDGQEFIRGVYAKYGIDGVMELLGKDISARLCGRGKTRPRTNLLSSLGSGPLTFEKVLWGIAILFGVAILFDALFKNGGGGGNSSPPPW